MKINNVVKDIDLSTSSLLGYHAQATIESGGGPNWWVRLGGPVRSKITKIRWVGGRLLQLSYFNKKKSFFYEIQKLCWRLVNNFFYLPFSTGKRLNTHPFSLRDYHEFAFFFFYKTVLALFLCEHYPYFSPSLTHSASH